MGTKGLLKIEGEPLENIKKTKKDWHTFQFYQVLHGHEEGQLCTSYWSWLALLVWSHLVDKKTPRIRWLSSELIPGSVTPLQSQRISQTSRWWVSLTWWVSGLDELWPSYFKPVQQLSEKAQPVALHTWQPECFSLNQNGNYHRQQTLGRN